MGKWDSLRETYERMPIDPDYATALAVMAEECVGLSLGAVAEKYSATRDLKESLDKQLAAANANMKALERVLIDRLRADGLTSIKTAKYNFLTSTEPHPSTKNPAELRAWAIANKPDEVQISHGTLKSYVKRVLEGEEVGEIPPGIEIFMHDTFTRKKA